MEKIQSFFWYCSGADTETLKKCPTDSNKYIGIGATIFFTGLFAAFAAAYAFYTVFDQAFFAIALGLVWGLMIFNLDRYIVSGMRKSNRRFQEFKIALPRILLAVMISIVIAKPLELKIFEKEINAELSVMAQESYASQENAIRNQYTAPREALQSEIATLKEEITLKAAKRDELARIAQQEADGTGGTGQRSPGPIYKIKKADVDQVESELQALMTTNNQLIAQKQEALTALIQDEQHKVESLEEDSVDGPAARLESLDRLSAKSTAIWYANIFILLLFIVVETSPIIVKLISQKGPYDYELETTEYRFEAASYKDKAFLHHEIKKQSEELSAREKDFVKERLDIKLDQA
ncbi:DUF4407 domain-containing protein [Marivirga sp. S37H4]|uniref:DUF4407 domain-containing protein n=1 Tax=Marivirga aurantiaca TaxID=2802615 RepID=A0A935C5I1_9BACT|nr:DUF4407 domain-containing protein [Marivirga aurantiaca]MBK6263829.1 DUF4407 domain-containing protein [Marivirga aurantiaca]